MSSTVSAPNRELLVEAVAERYPFLITLAQAAEIASAEVSTVHDWSSRSYFDQFKTGKGPGVRLINKAFTRWLVERN
ncbi:MAG: hypothetical protein GC162_17565 [Planctomycetes bacterium]|nr:hypothetical protein [Planctomycetota bacterium]